jgi:hypothetical protein
VDERSAQPPSVPPRGWVAEVTVARAAWNDSLVDALPTRLQQAIDLLRRARRQEARRQWLEYLETIAEVDRMVDECKGLGVRGAQAAGESDSQIARRLGVSQPAISKRYPRPDRAQRRRRWRRAENEEPRG